MKPLQIIQNNIDNIKKWEALGLSRDYVAKQLNIARDTFSKYYPNYISLHLRTDKNILAEQEYNKHKKSCSYCKQELAFNNRHQQFCSHTCSTKLQLELKRIANKRRSIVLKTFHCSNCNKQLIAKSGSNPNRIFCSKKCRNQNKPQYTQKCKICGKDFVWPKYKQTCSKSCTNLLLQRKSTDNDNCGGVKHYNRVYYKGITLGSTYELEVAKDLDKHNIKWTTCKWIPYIDFNGKHRHYLPDFYLPEYNIYLDPKNDFLIKYNNPATGFKDCDKIRLVCEQNKIKILILDKNHLSWEKIKQLISIP